MGNKSKGVPDKLKKNLKPIKKLKLISLIVLLLVICSVSIFWISTVIKNQKVNKSQAVPNQENSSLASLQPAQSSASASNPITKAAVQAGVVSSIERINQIVKFLTTNNQSGAYIFPSQNPPDQHVFSTSFELITPNSATIYASANFFPNQDAVYDTVEYVAMGCEDLAQTVFKNLTRVGMVKKNIIILDDGTVKVFLMPAGSGCVVIKKEIVQ